MDMAIEKTGREWLDLLPREVSTKWLYNSIKQKGSLQTQSTLIIRISWMELINKFIWVNTPE